MNRIFSLIGSVAFLFVAVAAFVWVSYDILQSSERVTEARTKAQEITARDAFAKSAAAFIADTATERATLGSFVIAPDETARAIEQVERVAKTMKLDTNIDSATIAPLDAAHHESLNLGVTARGPFVGLVRFGTVLESLPFVVQVKAVRFESADKGWIGTYTVQFLKSKSL